MVKPNKHVCKNIIFFVENKKYIGQNKNIFVEINTFRHLLCTCKDLFSHILILHLLSQSSVSVTNKVERGLRAGLTLEREPYHPLLVLQVLLCQDASTKDIAGQSANPLPGLVSGSIPSSWRR